MPALLPVPGVLKITYNMTVGGDTTTGWHLYFSYGPTPPTVPNLSALATAVVAGYNTSLNSHAAVGINLQGVTITDLSDPGASTFTLASPVTGGQPGPLAASSSVLVNFKINRRYRGGKPRVYVPSGFASQLATMQTWTGAFVSGFQTDFNTYITNIQANINTWGSGAAHVAVSYYLGGQWKPDHNGNYHRVPTPRGSPKVDVVTSRIVSTIVGSQRRRIRKV